MSTEAKVRKVVRDVLPKGKTFKIRWQPVGFGRYRVLRVITPAWRSLPRFERILKVQKAIRDGLAAKDRAGILRVSVLTANEYKRLHPALIHRGLSMVGGRRRPGNGK